MLKEAYQILPLEEWVGMWKERRLPPRALAVTFDDGYRGAFECAVPVLRGLGIPATFFLNSDFVANRALFWRCLYVEAVRSLGPTRVVALVREAWTEGAPGLDEESLRVWLREHYDPVRVPAVLNRAIEEAGRNAHTLASEHRPFARWEDWASVRGAGLRFGNHSADHSLLSRCDPARQRETILRGRSELLERLGEGWIPFAWPHGHPGSWDEASLEAVRATGHPCAFAGAGSPCGYEGDLYSIGRVPAFDEGAGALWRRLQEA